jgi:hypothetical protein
MAGRCPQCGGGVKADAVFSWAPTAKHRAASRKLVDDESLRLRSCRWFVTLMLATLKALMNDGQQSRGGGGYHIILFKM